uniref:Uncharacterized protein n=1 Tax=Pyxicephalus adspersus TaxID=30357 RepID=A0AAV2ZLA2_PYXAD|nr:TPA: hypothetical protein GDO54_004204 [Pyxicephalus adspersus]
MLEIFDIHKKKEETSHEESGWKAVGILFSPSILLIFSESQHTRPEREAIIRHLCISKACYYFIFFKPCPPYKKRRRKKGSFFLSLRHGRLLHFAKGKIKLCIGFSVPIGMDFVVTCRAPSLRSNAKHSKTQHP